MLTIYPHPLPIKHNVICISVVHESSDDVCVCSRYNRAERRREKQEGQANGKWKGSRFMDTRRRQEQKHNVTATNQPSQHSRKSRIMRTRKCTRAHLPRDSVMGRKRVRDDRSLFTSLSLFYSVLFIFRNFDSFFLIGPLSFIQGRIKSETRKRTLCKYSQFNS